MPIATQTMWDVLRAELARIVAEECLCAGKPWLPTESEFNPNCPVHEKATS